MCLATLEYCLIIVLYRRKCSLEFQHPLAPDQSKLICGVLQPVGNCSISVCDCTPSNGSFVCSSLKLYLGMPADGFASACITTYASQ